MNDSEPSPPPSGDWYEAFKQLSAAQQMPGSRFRDVIEFVFPPPPNLASNLTDLGSLTDAATEYGKRLEVDVQDLLPTGASIDARPSALGRGASGLGIAIVVLGVVGSIDGTINLARLVASLWRRWRTAHDDAPYPAMTLGAARYLCLADLALRVGDDAADASTMVFKGNVGPSLGAEISHTGSDLFYFLFATDDWTWSYLIDCRGRVIDAGFGQPLPKNIALYLPSLNYLRAPDELPFLLDENPPMESDQ